MRASQTDLWTLSVYTPLQAVYRPFEDIKGTSGRRLAGKWIANFFPSCWLLAIGAAEPVHVARKILVLFVGRIQLAGVALFANAFAVRSSWGRDLLCCSRARRSTEDDDPTPAHGIPGGPEFGMQG